MAVRVRLRLKSRTTGRELRVNALVNSGFETFKPQLLVPARVAELLGLWPFVPRWSFPSFRGFSGVSSRDFHLAHRALVTTVGSWVAVEPNGMGLSSTFNPPRLRALLSSPKRGPPVNTLSLRVYKPQTTLTNLNNRNSPYSEGVHSQGLHDCGWAN
jgi:hypothetical protein